MMLLLQNGYAIGEHSWIAAIILAIIAMSIMLFAIFRMTRHNK
jgi:hypothetical protein